MIDLNKKYRTAAGDEVILEGIDNDPDYPVYGLIINKEDGIMNAFWTLHGKYFTDCPSDLDLVEINENEKL